MRKGRPIEETGQQSSTCSYGKQERNGDIVGTTLAPPEEINTIALDNDFGDGLENNSCENHNLRALDEPYSFEDGEPSNRI